MKWFAQKPQDNQRNRTSLVFLVEKCTDFSKDGFTLHLCQHTQHHPFFLHSKCENDLRSFVLNHFRVTWQLNICENKRCETLSNNVKMIRFATNKSSFEVILNPLLTSKASYYTPLTRLTFFLYLVGARLGLFSGLKRKLENFSSKNGESMHHHHGKADPNFQRCVPN